MKGRLFLLFFQKKTHQSTLWSVCLFSSFTEKYLFSLMKTAVSLKTELCFTAMSLARSPKIEGAESMFSAGRSRKISIVAIIQSFAQLEQNYGKTGHGDNHRQHSAYRVRRFLRQILNQRKYCQKRWESKLYCQVLCRAERKNHSHFR